MKRSNFSKQKKNVRYLGYGKMGHLTNNKFKKGRIQSETHATKILHTNVSTKQKKVKRI